MTNGYAADQLGRALLTAVTHEDRETRRRADSRAAAWMQVLDGLTSGTIAVGSRTPVEDLPAWVTLEVLRGGFATGTASAEGALSPDELALARRIGVPAERRYLFGYFLSDAGLAELGEMLDNGCYRVDLPEEGALLTLAWLVRAGDRSGAMDLLDEIAPLASRLRFTPRSAPRPTGEPDEIFRTSAGEAATALRSRKEPAAVATQREVLAVWNPFSDRVLGLWLERLDEATGEISLAEAGDDWTERAAAIVAEYDRLAAVHTRATRHRRPKENLAIQIGVLRSLADGATLDPRSLGLLRHSVASSVTKRGLPGSAAHTGLRAVQSVQAATPAHSAVAVVVAERLNALEPDDGVAAPERLLEPIGRAEARVHGLDVGAALPPTVHRVVARTRSAPVETLVDEGVVPSSEVLAELVPHLSAAAVAAQYADPVLARLVAANYRAFRRRRSLLLVDLATQVQLRELPWVQAVAGHAAGGADAASAVLLRTGALALSAFPGTILPNPLVRELAQLAKESRSTAVFVEELAADIFMGEFSDKFRRAAVQAAGVLRGTVYERYYGIDFGVVAKLAAPGQEPATRRWPWSSWRDRGRSEQTFAELCFERANQSPDPWARVAAKGTVIEQGQILTSHNLAALVVAGVAPDEGWVDLAVRAVHRTTDLLDLGSRQEAPQRTFKDAAFAWRQAIFFLSVAESVAARQAVVDLLEGPMILPATMGPLLRDVLRAFGGAERIPPGFGRPFLAWTTTRHWVLDHETGRGSRSTVTS